MSPSAPQPDHAAPEVQELFEWVPNHCVSGTNGSSATPNCLFMPLPDLEAFLKAHNRTSKLLRALYSKREHHVTVAILEKWYIRVFTVLVLIGKGRYIEHFVQHHNLRDLNLPFLEKPTHFPTDPDDPKFWRSFYEKQFSFCAHYFRYNENYTKLEELSVLPIIRKEVLGQGGSAAIYKIVLHPFYDQLSPAADVFTTQAHGARPANTYVLKTYNTKDASNYYENEVEAFKKLATKDRIDRSLITFLGSYKQGDTHNILLEYADLGTLEDFFQEFDPPSLGEDIILFWERLFNVINALLRIHSTERPDSFCGPDILIGWHQDVKPRNILVLRGKNGDPYDVEFKLADLGLSHFKRTVRMDGKTMDSDIGGTKDYGAPECYRSDEFLEQIPVKVNSSVDIWSFGGVCSEAAVWVVRGKSGLKEYRDQRQQEIIAQKTSQDGICFHNGETVLQAVEHMHDRLLKKGEVRPADHITKQVLDQMVSSMLDEDPEGRQNARWLWKRSQKLLKHARTQLKEVDQPQTPKHRDSAASKAQFFGQNAPNTPPYTSDKAAQPLNRDPLPYGPPPNYPQYRSNSQMSGWPSSSKENPKRRSGTWSEQNTGPAVTPVSPYQSPTPPTSAGQAPRGSSPPDIYKEPQQRTSTIAFAPDGTATRPGGELWRNESSRYSLPNVPKDLNTLGSAFLPFGIRRTDSPPQEVDAATEVHPGRQVPSNTNFQSSDIFGPTLGSPVQHLENANTFAGREISYPETNMTPNKTGPKSPPTTAKTKSEKPYLSYKEAKQIREKRCALPRDKQDLLNDLKGRDHVFLIDDSLSMKDHWDDVVDLFSVFAYFAKRLDNNGLEMYFTVSERKETFKNTSPAVSHLKTMRLRRPSNINIRLGKILGEYQTELERQRARRNALFPPKPVKPLSLYVFTDGAWPGSDAAVAPVKAMIEKLQQLALDKEQVGIQFIRFGNDPKGIDRLEHLDSGLRKEYGKDRDIVDSEPFANGNLLKMLLGAIWDWFDDDDDDDNSNDHEPK